MLVVLNTSVVFFRVIFNWPKSTEGVSGSLCSFESSHSIFFVSRFSQSCLVPEFLESNLYTFIGK